MRIANSKQNRFRMDFAQPINELWSSLIKLSNEQDFDGSEKVYERDWGRYQLFYKTKHVTASFIPLIPCATIDLVSVDVLNCNNIAGVVHTSWKCVFRKPSQNKRFVISRIEARSHSLELRVAIRTIMTYDTDEGKK